MKVQPLALLECNVIFTSVHFNAKCSNMCKVLFMHFYGLRGIKLPLGYNLTFGSPVIHEIISRTTSRSEINFCAIKSYVRGSPDSSTSGVVIQRSGSMPPRNISCRLRYIADHTLQFYRAARFVKFVAGCSAVFVYDLHLRY